MMLSYFHGFINPLGETFIEIFAHILKVYLARVLYVFFIQVFEKNFLVRFMI